jgi:hypothetical protein
MATTVAFRTLDEAGKLPDNYVNPYYLEDLKRRVSVARAGGKLYAFDDCASTRAARSRRGCSRARRSCASATVLSTISPRAPFCGVPQPNRSAHMQCANGPARSRFACDDAH